MMGREAERVGERSERRSGLMLLLLLLIQRTGGFWERQSLLHSSLLVGRSGRRKRMGEERGRRSATSDQIQPLVSRLVSPVLLCSPSPSSWASSLMSRLRSRSMSMSR